MAQVFDAHFREDIHKLANRVSNTIKSYRKGMIDLTEDTDLLNTRFYEQIKEAKIPFSSKEYTFCALTTLALLQEAFVTNFTDNVEIVGGSKVVGIETELTYVKSKVVDLETEITDLESKIVDLEIKVAESKPKHADIKTEEIKIEPKVHDTEIMASELTAIDDAMPRIADIGSELADREILKHFFTLPMNEQLDLYVESEISNIERKLVDLETMIIEIERKFINLTELIDTQSKVVDLEPEIAHIECKVVDLEHKIIATELKVIDSVTKIIDIERKIFRLETRIPKIERKIAYLETKIGAKCKDVDSQAVLSYERVRIIRHTLERVAELMAHEIISSFFEEPLDKITVQSIKSKASEIGALFEVLKMPAVGQGTIERKMLSQFKEDLTQVVEDLNDPDNDDGLPILSRKVLSAKKDLIETDKKKGKLVVSKTILFYEAQKQYDSACEKFQKICVLDDKKNIVGGLLFNVSNRLEELKNTSLNSAASVKRPASFLKA